MTGNNRSAAAKLALLGAAALLVALGGCGRKAALDPPPSALAPPPPSNTAQTPNSPLNPFGLLDPNQPDEGPVATPRQKKRIILDPILD